MDKPKNKNNEICQGRPINTNFEEIFYQSPIGIFLYDKEGRLINANDSALKIARIQKLSDVLGTNIFDNPKIASKKDEILDKGLIKFQDTLDFSQIKEQNIYNPIESKIIDIDWTVSVTDSGYLIQIQDITKHKKAEEKVIRERNILNVIIESAEGPIFSIDCNYRYTSFNSQHAKVMKTLFDADIEIGGNLLDYHTNPEDRKNAKINADKVFNGETVIIESFAGDSPQNRQYFSIFHTPIKDSNGKITGAAVYVQDHTERKEAEEALKVSETQLKEAQRLSKVGNWEWSIETDIISWSDELYNIAGLDLERSAPKYEEHPKFYTKESFSLLDKAVKNTFKTGEPYNLLLELIRVDGEHRWVDAHGEVIKNAEGHIIGLRGTVQDINERKKVEEALSQSQKLLQDIIDGFPCPIFVKDTEGRFLTVNKKLEELLGIKNEELMGKTDYDIIIKELADYYRANDQKVLEEGKSIRIEEEADLIDGHHTFIANKFPIYDSSGKPYGVGSISTDITERKLLEEKLKAARANLEQEVEDRTAELKLASIYNRSLIEASVDPLVTIGPDGKITDVNLATESVTGYSRDDLIGTDFSDYFTEPEKARAGYQQVFQNGKVLDYPLEIKHKNGKITPILYNASVYLDESGSVVGVFASARDITEVKKAEEEIQKLANIVESSEDAIISKTFDGIITSWNKGAEILYGYSQDEIIGKNISILIPTDLKEEYKQFTNQILRGERVYHYERERIRKDGQVIDVALTLSPIFDLSGKLVGISTIARDISLHKQADKKLEYANKYNRSLIEASVDPLVTIGPDGKITDVNLATESVTGYSRDDLIGTDFSDYFTEPEKAKEGYQQVFQNGKVLDYPLEIKHKNGQITPVLYNASVYTDDNDKIIGVFAAARDITELKKAENKLKEYHDTLEEKVKKRTEELAISNAELEHFAYVTSHDLREPLRMITSFLQLLERRYSANLDQDANEFIGFAVDGAKRLDDMINDLLEYSKVNRKEQVFRSVNLEKVLESALINLIIPTEENNAVIDHDPLPTVYGDEKLLVQLFQNLIGNAIKYHGQEPPKIHISSIKENNQYIISIKDNGIGIESQHLERIFTIFQRLHRNDEYEGTGIGLAITQKIVHQHNGNIWVESEQGKGSTFYFTIPIK